MTTKRVARIARAIHNANMEIKNVHSGFAGITALSNA